MKTLAGMSKTHKQQLPGQRFLSAIPGLGQIQATPRDFSKLGDFSLMDNMHPSKICAFYRDIQLFELPFAPSDTDDFFFTRKIFNCGPDTTISNNRITDLTCGASFDIPFVLVGVAIVVLAETEGFTLQGAVYPTPSGAVTGDPNCPIGPNAPALPAVITACDEYCGSVDVQAANEINPNFGGGIRFGQLAFGWPTWRALEKWLDAFRLQMIVRQRFLAIDRSVEDLVQYFHLGFEGAGIGKYAPTPAIHFGNALLQCRGFPFQFGTGNLAISSLGESMALGPPAPYFIKGSPNFRGVASRFCPLQAPMLLCPGLPLNFQLAAIDIDPEALSFFRETLEPSCLTQSPALGGGVEGLDGNVGITCTIPVGQFKIGVVLFGFELWPDLCLDFLLRYTTPNTPMARMLSGVPYLYDVMRKAQAEGRQIDSKAMSHLHGVLGAPTQGQ